MIKIDMWYGNKVEDVDQITVSFYDLDCVYRGNLYKKGKIIGDYSCDDSVELQKRFPQIRFR